MTRRQERAATGLGLCALLVAVAAAEGPARWVFVGAGLGVAEEWFLGYGPQPPSLRPRFWLAGSSLAPMLPFLVLGTANAALWLNIDALDTPAVSCALGIVLGFLATVFGWRVCVRPALRDEDQPLTAGALLAPAGAAVVVAILELMSATPFAASLLAAGLAVWLVALVILLSGLWVNPPRVAGPARACLVAGAFALASLAVAAHGLARVDGKLAAKVKAIAERSEAIPLRTMATIRAEDRPRRRDALLVNAFAPRLFLASDQAAWPVNPVTDASTSKLIDRRTRTERDAGYPPLLPETCDRPKAKQCYVLSDRCFRYDADCGVRPGTTDYPYGTYRPPNSTQTLHPFGVIYVRILHRAQDSTTDSAETSAAAFKRVGLADRRLGGHVTDLLQYWLYYGYDRFEAVTPLGRLVQEHESDWEAVTVGLGSDRPLFVAYNAHCGGQWLRWNRVPAAFQAPQEGERLKTVGPAGAAVADLNEPTHPAIMVAQGSQASYPASGRVRIPDWTSCIFGTTKGDVVALAASVKETVTVAKEVVPVEVLGTDVHRPPMRFAGAWGLNGHEACLHLAFGLRIACGGSDAPGPETPRFKSDWKDPFGVIFDSHDWHEGRDPAG